MQISDYLNQSVHLPRLQVGQRIKLDAVPLQRMRRYFKKAQQERLPQLQ